MAEEFKPTTFTKKDADGNTKKLTAHTPADAVRLRFDGWKDSGKVVAKAPVRSTPTTNTAGDSNR